jgi:sulfate permease, SulP family
MIRAWLRSVRPERRHLKADTLAGQVAARDDVRAIVLDAETVPIIDVTSAQMLTELARALARQDVRLLLARDIGQVRDVLRKASPDQEWDQLHPTIDAAIAATRR